MKIQNNLLEGVDFVPSPNTSGPLNNPKLIVIHYTASGGEPKSDANYFSKKAAKASAHVIIGRDGSIIQCVPFNVRAWHAGVSTWRGEANCNSYSIGIEIQNWGLLTKKADGKFYSHRDVEVPSSRVIEAKNKLGNNGFWETYTPEQKDTVAKLIAELMEVYPSITEVVGHEDISPRRKIDPGPALYDFMRSAGTIRADSSPKLRKVNVRVLNVRTRGDKSATLVTKLTFGTKVEVIYDSGEWSQIKIPSTGVTGWVYDQYLA